MSADPGLRGQWIILHILGLTLSGSVKMSHLNPVLLTIFLPVWLITW